MFISLGKTGRFIPTDFTGLALWLDASDASTVTESGGAVTAWADKSGNGYNFASAGTGTGVVWDGSVMTFGGVSLDKYLRNQDAGLASVMEIANAKTVFITISADTSPAGGISAAGWYNSNSDRGGLVHRSDIIRMANYNGSAYVNPKSYAQVAASNLTLVTWQNNGATSSVLTVNQKASDGVQTPYAGGAGASLSIGARTDGGLPWDGTIGDVIIYDRILTSSEISLVEGYLNSRRNYALFLPEGLAYITDENGTILFDENDKPLWEYI